MSRLCSKIVDVLFWVRRCSRDACIVPAITSGHPSTRRRVPFGPDLLHRSKSPKPQSRSGLGRSRSEAPESVGGRTIVDQIRKSRTEECMLKRPIVAVIAITLVAAMSYADQSTSKVTIPVTRTNPTDGKQMYTSYCAPCHGVDARGTGPVAPALKTPPTDLTLLSRMNHGKFPSSHVVSVLQ